MMKKIITCFIASPLIFRIYAMFLVLCVVVTILPLLTPRLGFLYSATGSTLFLYMFTVHTLYLAVTAPSRAEVFWLAGFMVFLALTGVFDFYFHQGREDFGNPYLIYSPIRPLLTIGLPLLWMVAFLAHARGPRKEAIG